MTTGINHDRLTLFASPLVLAVAGSLANPVTGCAVAGAFVFGGCWLSPDLDIKSRPWRRWGILRHYWIPYMSAIPHRSFLSHGVIVGTLGRVFYLALPIIALSLLSGSTIQLVNAVWLNWSVAAAILIGLELSAIVHLAADGVLFR